MVTLYLKVRGIKLCVSIYQVYLKFEIFHLYYGGAREERNIKFYQY